MGVIDWWNRVTRVEVPQIAGLRSRKLHKAGSFSETGMVQSVAGGTSTVPGRIVLASRIVPSGCALQLDAWSVNVIDTGNSNQIYFALLRNGTPVSSNVRRVSGETFGVSNVLDVQEVVDSGVIELVGYNISGMLSTLEADALAVATSVRCQGWFTGTLLSERGGI